LKRLSVENDRLFEFMSGSILPDYSQGNPYRKLYIYYLTGKIPPTAVSGLVDFIGDWEEEGISFLFFSKEADSQLKTLLVMHPELSLLDRFQMSYEEWQGTPTGSLRVGEFLIFPPWIERDSTLSVRPELLPIILDPGVVFGNGTHATTQDCLEAVSLALAGGNGGSVLDLGTGSGLLALAAMRCGARSCIAIDFNALATKTAALNVRLNHWENQILVVQGRAEDYVDTPAELLIANIHFEIMRKIIQSPGFLNKKCFILSGLMHSEAKAVRDYLANLPVTLRREWCSDGIWHTFLGVSKGGGRGPIG
jgi:ribosomal protein L11 methyltransferase